VSGTPTLYAGATGTEDYGARVVAITAPDHGLAYRFVVDDAVDPDDAGTDEAGFGGPNEWITSMADFGGRLWLATVRLRPLVRFEPSVGVSTDALGDLHHQSHEECFIANSVKTTVTIEPRL
jgi:hypothetical protein